MISEIKDWRCKYCKLKGLLPARIRIRETAKGNIYWRLKCGICGKTQEIHVSGTAG